jgi:predicted RNA-binding protein with PIN domain
MQNLINIEPEQKEILENSISILYTSKNNLGNFIEKEVIKYNNKFYRITATNKHLTEFSEV